MRCDARGQDGILDAEGWRGGRGAGCAKDRGLAPTGQGAGEKEDLVKADQVRHAASGPVRAPQRNAEAGRSRPDSGRADSLPIKDSFESLTGTRLTSDGRLRLIVSFQDAESAKKVRDLCSDGKCFRISGELPLVNGFTAEVEPKQVNTLLKALPPGSRVAVDRELDYPDPRFLFPTRPKEGPPKDSGTLDVSTALIGIQKVWDQGYTGKGQTIAVIDSGIHPHPDLKDKIVGWVDLKDGQPKPMDTFGHGTHVAGIAAGTGAKSAGTVKGVAPDADLVGVRITSVAEAIKGIQWVIENKEKYNISVLNMSLGDFATRSYKDDPWAQAAQKAVDAGLIVVVAAGNDGPSEGSVSTPGTHPDVITVGALDDRRTMDRGDDTVADFSSRGPTSIDGLTKPDLLAPGVSIFGPLAPGATLDVPELPHIGTDYFAISGTSMATPMVAGLAAILKQANPELTHHQIKEILVHTADRYLPDESNVQGAGLLDASEALEVALDRAKSKPAPAAQSAGVVARKPAGPEYEQGFLFA